MPRLSEMLKMFPTIPENGVIYDANLNQWYKVTDVRQAMAHELIYHVNRRRVLVGHNCAELSASLYPVVELFEVPHKPTEAEVAKLCKDGGVRVEVGPLEFQPKNYYVGPWSPVILCQSYTTREWGSTWASDTYRHMRWTLRPLKEVAVLPEVCPTCKQEVPQGLHNPKNVTRIPPGFRLLTKAEFNSGAVDPCALYWDYLLLRWSLRSCVKDSYGPKDTYIVKA